jgi:hypothetical protein
LPTWSRVRREDRSGLVVARLVAELRTETGRADTKASVLIAAMGLGLGAPLGLSRPTPADGCRGSCSVIWWFGCLFWVAALGCLLISLVPRYRRSSWTEDSSVSSFVDIHRAAKAGNLRAAIRSTGLDEQASLLTAATDLSRIVILKYRWIRAAMTCFALAVSALALSVLTL